MNDDKDKICCPPDVAALPLPSDDDELNATLARLARALGHPARVAIIRLLIERDECIAGELGAELPLAASTVSQHIKQLKDAGLIRGEVDGPRICYCVDPAVIALFKSLVEGL